MNSWLNIYKPRGISSAWAVALIKRLFRGDKIGHTGTLDMEAEGVLPIAIGQATKLTSILMDATKTYVFTVKFGAKTDTADLAGKVIDTCQYIPSLDECINVCPQFIGQITQTPPAYSALKVNGVRAYKLAREEKEIILQPRAITIYNLELLDYNPDHNSATYVASCSKGTYIRTLAEDISLSLQSLGFVLELRRTKVGMFTEENSVNVNDFVDLEQEEARLLLNAKCLKIEDVLDDIPVFDASDEVAKKISFGQKVCFESDLNYDLIWIRFKGKIIATGSLHNNDFKSLRVFNYNNGE
jgi:tRNA pseudouridine55 synthase